MLDFIKNAGQKIRGFLFRDIWKTFFWFFAFVATLTLAKLSQSYGITWDEWETSNNGIRALKNILTWGRDQSLMDVNLAYLYTHFFTVVVTVVYALVFNDLSRLMTEGLLTDTQILRYFDISHLVNSFFGMLTAVYAGLFAKKFGGWRVGFITLLLIVVSPRFIGHAMNNSKDIPFAAAYIFSIYAMSFFLERLPQIRFKDCLLTALGLGICLGTRLGGAILIVYLVALTGIIWIRLKATQKANFSDLLRIGIAITVMLTGAAAICLLFWPYARTHSPMATLQAFLTMSNFEAWNYLVLFEGKMTMSVDLPWYYIPKWILISSPLFFPIGLALCGLFFRHHGVHSKRMLLLLATAAFFPLFFIILRDSNVYDSWRHLLFVYPPLVIFCAMGWSRLWEICAQSHRRIALGILLLLLGSEPLSWAARNPRHIGVYFSPLAGGIQKAFTKYESDYWGNCLRESSEWLAEYHKKNYGNFPFAWVQGDGTAMQTYPYLKKALGEYYHPFGYPRDFLKTNPYVLYVFGKNLPRNLPWNYAVLMSRQRTPDELKNEWPPPGTLHTVSADGVAVCAVVRNDDFYSQLANIRQQNQSQPELQGNNPR